MNKGNLVESSPIVISGQGKVNNKKFKLKHLQPIAIIFGIGLLGGILYEVGFNTVIKTISLIGWGFLGIVFLNGFRHILRAAGIYLAVPKGNDSFKFKDAVTTRLAGEAVGILTFTGMMASETTKTALLKKKLNLTDSLATIVIDNLLYDLSVLIFILIGAFMMLGTFVSSNPALNPVLYFIVALAFGGLISFTLIFSYRLKPITSILNRFGQKSWFPKFIAKRQNHLSELEDNILHFYENHQTKFYLMIAINLAIHSLSIAEVYGALYLLGFTPYLVTSTIIESITKLVNFTFSFIPGNLGVYEGGAAVIFHTLGYASATGVALALVRRGAILFWTFVGLLILARRSILDILGKNRSKMP